MPIGVIALVLIAILIYLGLAHRVLDRMRLTDRGALAVLAAMVLGTFIDIPLIPGRVVVNVGGAIIPLGIVVYLVATADQARERARAVGAAVAAAFAVYLIGRLMPSEPGQFTIIDPSIAYGLVAGVLGYVAGRSRRAAFVAGISGVILAEIAVTIRTVMQGVPFILRLGGAGILDAVVIAGLVAVGLAEVVGEARERLAGTRDDQSGGEPGE